MLILFSIVNEAGGADIYTLIHLRCAFVPALLINFCPVCCAGAGKTTTFNILIGDTTPTSGTAIIAGRDIRTDRRKVYSATVHG